MWDDMLALILNCVLELLDLCVDPEEFWRFSICFFTGIALACLVEWISKVDRPSRRFNSSDQFHHRFLLGMVCP